MKTFFTLLLILIFNRSFNSQTLIHPDIPPDLITDLHYLNDIEIIFINSGGNIYKSYDGGNTWELKAHYQNTQLAQLQFLDDKLGFIRTNNNLIFTTDGGETWNEQDLSIQGAYSFLPVSLSVLIKATSSGNIQRLDNFFNNWEVTYWIPTYVDSGYDYTISYPYGYIIKLLRLNNGNLIALGTNENAFYKGIMDDSLSYLLKSEDSGLSWDTLWIGLEQLIKDIVFINDSSGWMISDTSLFKSSNGGKTWNLQNAPYNQAYYKSLFAKENNIYLLDYYNNFIKSTNSGVTWSINDLGTYNNLFSIVFNDDYNGFLLGQGLLKTTNAGQNWQDLNPYVRNDIYDLDFISTQEGIAFGNNGVYKTYDGGYSWIPKFNPGGLLNDNAGVLEMLNDSVGFLLSRYENIYKTTDAGENWEKITFYEENQHFDNLEFYNENLGILTAWEESVPGSQVYDISNAFISTNGGADWIKKPLDSLYFEKKLKFTDPAHLWGINHYGLWLSRDTAKTWENIYQGNGFTFDFYDSLFGVYSGYGDSFVTTDGGVSWKTINKNMENLFSRLFDCKILGLDYSGRYRVLETGTGGAFILTYVHPNGEIDEYGSHQESSYTGTSLHKIEVFVEGDFPYVWVAGHGFTILYRQYEKIEVNVNEENNSIKTFSLFQNYPNPFNPSTTIRYQIPQRGFVSLEIYNLLGEEIKTLVNEEKSAGTYNIEFNAGNLSSGIYFYTLRAGNFIETKKFILLK